MDTTSWSRFLSGSIFDKIGHLKNKVNHCWGESIYDDANGYDVPIVTCDFDVPKDFYSAAEIRVGSCDDFNEPAAGELTTSGKIRTVYYPKITLQERRSAKFIKEFCARSDSFYDIDGSGNLTSVSMAIVSLEITYTIKSDHDYLMDVKSNAINTNDANNDVKFIAITLGSLAGFITLAISIVVMKGRSAGGKQTRKMNDSGVSGSYDAEVV